MRLHRQRERLFDGVQRRVRGHGSKRPDQRRLSEEQRQVTPLAEQAPRACTGPEPARALAVARAGLGLEVDDVVERLRLALGLRESLRARLTKAYQDLELDALPAAKVHDSVWNALRDILRVDARRLAGGGSSARTMTPTPRDPDEIDLLFHGSGLR